MQWWLYEHPLFYWWLESQGVGKYIHHPISVWKLRCFPRLEVSIMARQLGSQEIHGSHAAIWTSLAFFFSN